MSEQVTFYSVASGVDSRHLLDVVIFDQMWDARDHYDALNAKAKKLQRCVRQSGLSCEGFNVTLKEVKA